MEAMKTFLLLLLLRPAVSSLELIAPSVHTTRLGSDARIPCRFTVDELPVDLNHLTISWYFRDTEILSYSRTVRTTSSRYSLSTEELLIGVATLTISNIQIPDGGMYKCSVIYSSERKEKEVRLDIGAPPQVTVTDKMAVVNAESVLVCSITGFYPENFDVKWFKDGEKLNNISTEDPRRNSDRTYSVNSAVTITPTEEDKERIISCRVQHDFLQVPLQKDFRMVFEG
ncbi:natural cytotoxicity triggering receptor 3 ligand 1-like [Phyllobates terribilis]|uniref:natural cytotoxicity triggering receptor 3 ligand 1-like n=1 Tax=Phyllobates terribilis TaxID=111132 RepID=UPI003CCAF0CE